MLKKCIFAALIFSSCSTYSCNDLFNKICRAWYGKERYRKMLNFDLSKAIIAHNDAGIKNALAYGADPDGQVDCCKVVSSAKLEVMGGFCDLGLSTEVCKKLLLNDAFRDYFNRKHKRHMTSREIGALVKINFIDKSEDENV